MRRFDEGKQRQNFPSDELFLLYKRRLHKFIDAENVTPETLDSLNQEYIFYLIYGGIRSAIRFDDKEHIQPFSLLDNAGVRQNKINSIGNLILIDKKSESDKATPNDKELDTWLPDFAHREEFTARHLIPENQNLWTIGKFSSFLKARQRLIVSKIKFSL